MNILSEENKCNILFGLHHSEKGGKRERPINLKELIIYTQKIYLVCFDLFYWYTTVQFRVRSRKIIVSQQRSIINKYSREFFLVFVPNHLQIFRTRGKICFKIP